MAPKRSSPEEKEKAKVGRSKLRRCRCKGMTGQKFFTRLIPQLESMIQTAVQDGIQKYLLNHVLPSQSVPRHPNNQIQEVSRYQLHFGNTFPSMLFTGRAIETIQIFMKDAGLEKTVTSGVFSSLKIKVLVLNGEFCGDGQEVWTEEEFVRHILSERPGKPPLLTGKLSVSLSNGVGSIVGATFTDNSSWTKRGFRLGAVVFDERVGDTRVHEAVSELFEVKDRRGERNQKNCPPLLNSEVWNLRNIGKNGPLHKNLMNGGVKTVQDLLKSFVMDPDDVFRISGMSRMKWEATLKHAFECALGNQLYSFHYEEKGLFLIFNSILQLVGANGQGPYLLDFNLTDKKDLVNFAYKKSTAIVPFHGKVFHSYPTPFPALNATSMSGSIPQISNFQFASHDKSSEGGVQNQLYAPCGEVSNDLSMGPCISHGQQVDSSFQRSSGIRKEVDSRMELDREAAMKQSLVGKEAESERVFLLEKQVEELKQQLQIAEVQYKEKLSDKEIYASSSALLSPACGTSTLPSVLSEANLPSTQFVSQHQSGAHYVDHSDHFQDNYSGLGVQSSPYYQFSDFDEFYVDYGEENLGFSTAASTRNFEEACTSYEEFVALPTQVLNEPGGETGTGITSSSPSKLVHLTTVIIWVTKIKRVTKSKRTKVFRGMEACIA